MLDKCTDKSGKIGKDSTEMHDKLEIHNKTLIKMFLSELILVIFRNRLKLITTSVNKMVINTLKILHEAQCRAKDISQCIKNVKYINKAYPMAYVPVLPFTRRDFRYQCVHTAILIK